MLHYITHSRFTLIILPLLLLAAQLVAEQLVTGPFHDQLLTENGPVETLEFILLVGAFIVAVCLLLELKFKPPVLLSVWVLIAALGCFYVAGEEVSWGQHFLNWSTPEYWAAVNDQEETNLHNTSAWFDQKPRLLLEIGVLVGGLLLPLYRRFSKKGLPGWLVTIAPPDRLWFIAAIVLFVKIADKFGGATEMYLFGRSSEVIEFYLFYFILLYLVDLRQVLLNPTERKNV